MNYCRKNNKKLIIFLLIAISISVKIYANENKVANAIKVNKNEIKIDGIINEKFWDNCQPISDFIQKDPNEGSLPNGKIQVKFLYDEANLYISAVLSHGNEIRATTSRRDEAGNSERIIFSFDTYKDHRTAYSFGVTATGVRIDYSHQNDHEYNRDYSYEPVWSCATKINDSSWSVEVKIPFTQLRFNELPEQIWGLNINWWIPAQREDIYWILIPKNEWGWSSRMGELRGIKNIEPTSRIELMPYISGNIIHDPSISNDNPLHNVVDYNGRAGLDFKMGLGPDFSIDATINPDFGQVEADPAEVNLTAYETFFDEKRPFFIEGKQLLQGYGSSFFYSRRIGQEPKMSVDGNYTKVPTNTQILGATKLTGRNQNGLSLGILSALTNSEEGSSAESPHSTIQKTIIAPMTNYNVLRVKQEFGKSDISSIGILLTNVYRNINDNTKLSEFYVNNALTGDTDWFFRFDSSKYQFDGHIGFSYLKGDKNVITAIQSSSAHYFQRPDASHLKLDTNKTNLFGLTGLLKFSKIAGENWLWEINGAFISPELELNDMGQFHKADLIFGYTKLIYRENTPNDFFHSYQISADCYNEWDFGWNHLQNKVTLIPSLTFHNRSTLNSGLWYDFSTLSKDKTRGGPLMKTYNSIGGMIEYSSDWTANNQFTLYSEANKNELNGWDWNLKLGGTFKLIERFQFSIKPSFVKGCNPQQYVDQLYGGNQNTFGKRYIFAQLNLQNISLPMRLNFALTPDFTIEYYLEPFASSGNYSKFGELKAPSTFDVVKYGTNGTTIIFENGNYIVHDNFESFEIKNPDFYYLSYRSNLVFRWEFLPGSTFYIVWQQNKKSYSPNYTDISSNSLWDSFQNSGINTIALKLSYWLPVN